MLFSIIIPTYNRADFIYKTIKSLLSQSYDDFEIIVVDDGSTDNTRDVVLSIIDKRIRYYQKTNAERGAARNYGASLARGSYLNFFDSDDIAYRNHLETAREFIKSKDSPEVFHLNYDIKDAQGRVLSKKRKISSINRQIFFGNILSCNGVFLRQDVFGKFKFSEDRSVSGSEDYLLWVQLTFNYKIHSVDVVTSSLIQHNSRSVVRTDVEKLIQRKNILIEKLDESCNRFSFYRNQRNIIVSNTHLYVSLHLALLKDRRSSIKYLISAIKSYPPSLFTVKAIVVLKKLFF